MKKILRILFYIFCGIGIYIVGAGGFAFIIQKTFDLQTPAREKISGDELLSALQAKGIDSMTIKADVYEGKFNPDYRQGIYFQSLVLSLNPRQFQILSNSNATIETRRPKGVPLWKISLTTWLPIFFLGLFSGFLMSKAFRKE